MSERLAAPPEQASDAPAAVRMPGPTTYAVTSPGDDAAHGGVSLASQATSAAPFHVGAPDGATASV